MDSAEYHDYPYRSHGQPLLAYAALSGCLFVLFVANGAYLWNGFHQSPFLSSYLTVSKAAIFNNLHLANTNNYIFLDHGVSRIVDIVEGHSRS